MVWNICLRFLDLLDGALCKESWHVMPDHRQCVRNLLQRIRDACQCGRLPFLPLHLAEVRLGLLHDPVGPAGTLPLRQRFGPRWQRQHGGKVKDWSRVRALVASFECPIQQPLEREPLHIAGERERENCRDGKSTEAMGNVEPNMVVLGDVLEDLFKDGPQCPFAVGTFDINNAEPLIVQSELAQPTDEWLLVLLACLLRSEHTNLNLWYVEK